MKKFNYFKPKTLEQLFELMKDYPRYGLIAGGTNMVFQLKEGVKKPDAVIDLKGIKALSEITEDGEYLSIGAGVSVSEIEEMSSDTYAYPILSQCAQLFSSTQIKNRGTIGGNLCSGSPTADYAAVLAALNARLILKSKTEERHLLVEDFFLNKYLSGLQPKCKFCRRCMGRVAVQKGEVLTEICIPKTAGFNAFGFVKTGNTQPVENAIASAAVCLKIQGSKCLEASVVLGGVSANPIRSVAAEDALTNACQIDLKEIKEAVAAEVHTIDDIAASASYRKKMAGVAVKRALYKALKKRGDEHDD